jgi:nitrate reductase assembly molybdenum cofactor insertion protein NarJ
MEKRGKKIFSLLAAVLEYPTDRLVERTNVVIKALEGMNREASRHLAEFRDFCLLNSVCHLEDIYIRTFDLNAACCPFVGHHLLGQDRSRLLFAAKLKEDYLSHVDSHKKEKPDHIAVLLRSLTVQESVEEARELISCCLIPAVKKMLAALTDRDNPYRHVLHAVLLTLQSEHGFACRRFEQFAGAR